MHPLEPLIVHLKKGLPAMIPFDTCYGFVCDGLSREACARLYALKERPSNQPSALVVPDTDTIAEYAELNSAQRVILDRLLPGGVTVILRLKEGVELPAGFVQTKYGTASFRVVRTGLINDILERFKRPLLATSANLHNRPVVLSRYDLMLQPFNKELIPELFRMDTEVFERPAHSTVVDLTTNEPEVIRKGIVSEAEIKRATR